MVCGTEQQVHKNYFCVNLTNGQPKDILKTIMRMDDEVLEKAGLDMDRIGVLAKAFSDRQTYLQKIGLGHSQRLLNQIKEQFDVMEAKKNKRGILVHEESNTVVEITEDILQMGNQKFTFRSGDFEVESEKKEPKKLQ